MPLKIFPRATLGTHAVGCRRLVYNLYWANPVPVRTQLAYIQSITWALLLVKQCNFRHTSAMLRDYCAVLLSLCPLGTLSLCPLGTLSLCLLGTLLPGQPSCPLSCCKEILRHQSLTLHGTSPFFIRPQQNVSWVEGLTARSLSLSDYCCFPFLHCLAQTS